MEVVGALIGVFVVLLIYGGLFFWAYWLSFRALLLISVRLKVNHPVGLFAIACACLFALYMGLNVIMMMMALVPMIGPIIVILPMGVASLGGIIGWIVVGVKRVRNRAKVRAFREANPLPKTQFWIQDLMLAVFYFAGLMSLGALLFNATLGEYAQYAVGLLAIYLLAASGLGFYISLDLLRRYKGEPYDTWARIGILLGCLIFSTISGLIGMLIVWRAWQKTLLTLAMRASDGGAAATLAPLEHPSDARRQNRI